MLENATPDTCATTSARPGTFFNSQELDAVLAGSFSKWAPYDVRREGIRFHKLRDAIVASRFRPSLADQLHAELVALAAERGRSEAETFVAIRGGLPDDYVSEEPLMSRKLAQLVDDPSDSRYFRLVWKSAEMLWYAYRSRGGEVRFSGFRPKRPNRELDAWMKAKGSTEVEMISAFRLAALPVLAAAGYLPDDPPQEQPALGIVHV
jgi:hypothetical protein